MSRKKIKIRQLVEAFAKLLKPTSIIELDTPEVIVTNKDNIYVITAISRHGPLGYYIGTQITDDLILFANS
ncbi:MAG: hypothetical protein ACTSVW_00400 [Candidatus Njordarchaeales archaeon]